MPRYIDADKLIEKYERMIKDPWNKSSAPSSWASAWECVIADIDDIPTADVVPKSEVAKEFTCFVGDPHKLDRCPYLDEIEKAKTEIASEIFAEMNNIINDYKLSERNLQLIQHGEPSIDQRYAELKKKYTEESK